MQIGKLLTIRSSERLITPIDRQSVNPGKKKKKWRNRVELSDSRRRRHRRRRWQRSYPILFNNGTLFSLPVIGARLKQVKIIFRSGLIAFNYRFRKKKKKKKNASGEGRRVLCRRDTESEKQSIKIFLDSEFDDVSESSTFFFLFFFLFLLLMNYYICLLHICFEEIVFYFSRRISNFNDFFHRFYQKNLG